MGKGADIATALMARIATLSVGSPALQVEYPEHQEAFTPPADGKYLTVDDFPNVPAWEGLSGGRLDQGLLQITVVWPKNKGIIKPKAAADTVIAHFPKGLDLFSGVARVKIQREPWQSQPLSDAQDLRIPVTIPWTA